MKLCIKIIEEALAGHVIYNSAFGGADVLDPECGENCGDDVFDLVSWEIWDGGAKLEPGVLYLARAEALPETASIRKGTAIICVGMPAEYYTKSPLRLLAVDVALSMDALTNTVNRLFFEYNTLELKLTEAVSLGRSIQYFVELMAPFFNHNELIVCDENFKLVGRSNQMNHLCEISDIPQPNPEELPSEVVTFFKNDIIFYQVRNVHEPFFYEPSIFIRRGLDMNVFHGGEYACRVVLAEDVEAFRGYETGLVKFFTSFIQLVYDLSLNRDGAVLKDHMADMLRDLLNGDSVEIWRLENNLKERKWQSGGAFLCAAIKPSERDVYNRTISYYCQMFNRDFRGCCTFEYEGNILCVIDLEYYDSSLDRFYTEYQEILRDGYFMAGYSREFGDLRELQQHYRQAVIALRIGLRKYPFRWHYKFSDMVLDYMDLKLTEELDAPFMCAPEIIKLHRYDKENQSDYLRTLKVYLDNQMNGVKAAKALFIHRATMEYRLSRIEALTGIDFKNSDQTLYFTLSIRLLIS